MKRLIINIFMFSFTVASYSNSLNDQLWQAILDGNELLSVELLKQGADINALDKQGLALMHRYASSGNEFMINWLFEHGADINVRDLEGSTPIFYALLNGHYRRVYQIITLGADVDVENINGMTPMSFAEHFEAKLFIKLLKNPKSYTTKPITIELFSERQKSLQENNWSKAIALAKQEFKQASKEWGKTSPYYTRGITDLGLIYTQLGKFHEAEKCFKKSLKHWETTLPNSEQYYHNLTALAFLYRETYRFDEALIMYNECATQENTISNPQILWQIYSNRAAIYTQLADYEKADVDYRKALQLVKELPETLQLQAWCSTTGNYAMMHYYQNTPESIKSYVTKLHDVLGVMEEHSMFDQNYLRFKQQLCVYEEEFGNILLAEEHVNELLVVTESLLGKEHDDYLIALNLAAEIALKKDEYSQAYDLLTEALNLIKQHHTTQQTKIEWSIVSNWASLVDLILEDASTQWAHEFAYHKTQEIFGEESVYFLQQLNNLGVFWSEIDQHDYALPFQRDAYFKSKKLYGDNNINTLTKGYNLWHTYAAIPTKRDSAYFFLKENNIHVRTYIQNMFGIMSEKQREEFWNRHFSAQYSVTRPSFLIDYAKINPEAIGEMYNDVLFTRGLLLNSNDAFNRIIITSPDSILQNKYRQLLAIKTNLNSSQIMNSEIRHQLEKQKDELEREIMLASETYRIAQENFTIKWQDIQNVLNDDEVAIEFTINSINKWGQFDEKSDSIMYNALILRKGDLYPQLVPLFERDELNQFYGNNKDIYEYYAHQDAAYNLIWSKIEPYLQQCKTIYFSPTHALAQIALEALPITQDSVLGDYYNMYRLTSTREILKIQNNDNMPLCAALYGGISYDVSLEDMLWESEQYAELSHSYYRSLVIEDTINRGRVNYLPGTKIEVESIQQTLQASNCGTTMFIGNAANEESFTTLSSKPNDIIHLATHGFFWHENDAKEKDIFTQYDFHEEIDPLSRCGLLFAGANMAYQGHADQIPEGVQDGILTAREISMMDLSSCDLVVLSACETGIGEYSTDGTIGLQRAFKQTGVQSIIMTLWPVNDRTTQFLMTEFYNNWIGKHQSKREAFRNAQNTVRTKYEEPEYWAGFIMLD